MSTLRTMATLIALGVLPMAQNEAPKRQPSSQTPPSQDQRSQAQASSRAQSSQAEETIAQRFREDLTKAGLSENDARQQAESLAKVARDLQEAYERDLQKFQSAYAEALASGEMSRDEAQDAAQQMARELGRLHLAGGSSSESSGGRTAELQPQQKEQIAELLRRHDVESDRIDELRRKGFPQEEVRKTVEEAQRQAGRSDEQARQLAAVVANEVERQKGASSSSGGATGQGAGLDPQEKARIARLLEEEGVERQRIQRLEQSGFPNEDVREAVQRARVEQGAEQQEAEQQARRVAQQVERMKATGLRPASFERGSSGSEEITRLLRQQQVDQQRIQELEQQGFREDAVRRAVEEAQREAGKSSDEARQTAQEVAQRVQQMQQQQTQQQQQQQSASGSGGASEVRRKLEQAGVRSSEIQRLEQEGFPKDETTKAMKEAYDRKSRQAVEEIERLLQQQEGRQQQEGQQQQSRKQESGR